MDKHSPFDVRGAEQKDTPLQSESPLKNAYFLLRTYAIKRKKSRIDFKSFAQFVKRYVDRYGSQYPQLEIFSQNTNDLLTSQLLKLAESEKCSLEYDRDAINVIIFSNVYVELIRKAYKELEVRPEKPFPSEESLGLMIPAGLISAVNLKTDFVTALGKADPAHPIILRLIFPDYLSSMIITSELLADKLLEYAVYKIRSYLSSRNNLGYFKHKLQAVFKGNDHALNEILNNVVTKPGKVINTLYKPSEFSFRFWAHFVNSVIQELKEKTDLPAEEQGCYQASYLLGFYNVYYKGVQQKEHEKQAAVKRLEEQFRKPPYVFTIQDFYELKDLKGVPLIRKDTRDIFLEFLENKTKTEPNKSLPEVIRLKNVQKKEYYIQKDLVIPLFIKKLYETAKEIKDSLIEKWESLLKQDMKNPAMIDDNVFASDLTYELKSNYPLFYAFLNFNLLFLAKEETKIGYDLARDLDLCFDTENNRLKPIPEILKLDRKELLETAKLSLPIWQRSVLLKFFIGFFMKLFRGVNGEGEKAKQARPVSIGSIQPAKKDSSDYAQNGRQRLSSATKAAYKKALKDLKDHFVGKNKTVAQRLDELIEKWNPLYNEQAKRNLVEDVNAMIRDFIRGIKKGFRIKPPDARRIQAIAEKLAENEALKRITKKEYFRRYIEAYIVKILGE